MIKSIRLLLGKVIDDIDAGNSNINAEEANEIIEYLTVMTNKYEKLSIYQACKYLNISRATFDHWVKIGKIPKGRKQQGFKELFYYRQDLDHLKVEP
jgi:excisionase family DNA binding protein